jgi:hypothetical protein
MFSLLFKTELEYIEKYLLLAVASYVVLLVSQTFWASAPIPELREVSMLIFISFLAIYGSEYGAQKRKRLHAHLPVSRSEAYFATWLAMVVLLLVHAVMWIVYAALVEPDTFITELLTTPEIILHTLIVIALATIGIDLFTYQPRYLAWLYIGGISSLVLGFVFLEAEDLIDLEALGALRLLRILDSPWDLVISAGTLAVLIGIDHYIFTNNENFLGG